MASPILRRSGLRLSPEGGSGKGAPTLSSTPNALAYAAGPYPSSPLLVKKRARHSMPRAPGGSILYHKRSQTKKRRPVVASLSVAWTKLAKISEVLRPEYGMLRTPLSELNPTNAIAIATVATAGGPRVTVVEPIGRLRGRRAGPARSHCRSRRRHALAAL